MSLATTKICFKCKMEKPISEFYKSNTRYFQRECKKCNQSRKHKWHQTEQGKRSSANTKLKRRFGVTIEEYEALVAEVGGHCEICGAAQSANGCRLALDHNHITMKIRGVLCKACNIGIGVFFDNVDLLRKAATYLERTSKTGEE